MADTIYTYSVSADFPGGKVNTTKLAQEIRASAITIALDYVSTDGDVISIAFKAALPGADKTVLDGDTTGPAGGLIAVHDSTVSTANVQTVQFANSSGIPVNNYDVDGNPIFIHRKTAAAKFNQISPNWCDKTTWYERSVQSTNETLLDSGDHLTFNSANNYWIDMTHGKMFNEDILVKNNNNKWLVSVTANGVAVHENSPGQTDKDYTVNYVNGTVTFNSTPATPVVASYWYSPNTPGNSTWTIAPPNGTKIELLRVEVQFSKDLELRDTMCFQAVGWVDVFAPQLMGPPYNFPSHTLIPLGDPIRYKTVTDYIAESNGAYPNIIAFGGSYQGGWRATTQDMITLVWDYVSRTDLRSTQGVALQLFLKNDTHHAGAYATGTFYCVQLPDA